MDDKIGEDVIPSAERKGEDIDVILEQAGPYTPYQIIILISTTYLSLFVVYNNVLTYFTGNSPPWKCVANATDEFCKHIQNGSISIGDDRYLSRCHMNRSSWEYTTKETYSFVTEFDLVCGKTYMSAIIGASYYFGGVLGSLLSGSAADVFGRKPVIVLTSILTTVSSIASAFITSSWQLTALSICRGAGAYCAFACGLFYQSEVAPPTFRSISTNILLIGYSASFLYIDLLAYYIEYWRMLSLYASIPLIPVVIVTCFLPESPRWLISNGQYMEARLALKTICGSHDEPMINIKKKVEAADVESGYSLLDLFRNTKVLKVTLATGLLWFLINPVYYIIAFESSNLGGDKYEAFALSSSSDFIAYIISACLCNRFGRKKLTIVSMTIAAILLGMVTLVPKSLPSRYIITLTMMMCARLACDLGISVLFVWTPEIFPTVVRSRGFFICTVLDRIGVVAVPFVTEILQDVNFVLPYVIAGVMSVIAAVICLYLPETNGRRTRETYEDFFQDISTKVMCDIGHDNIELRDIEGNHKLAIDTS